MVEQLAAGCGRLFLLVPISSRGKICPMSERPPDWIMSVTSERSFMSAKYRPTVLGLFTLLFALPLAGIALGQQTATEFFWRGMTEMSKNDLDGAIADFTKAIELNPKYAQAYLNRGNAKAPKGDLDGAIADYSKAIELNPKSDRNGTEKTYLNRGQVKQAKGDLDGAIADYSKAIELNPKSADAYNYRGKAKKAKGDLDGADKDFAQAKKLQSR
jgi:tetratricopeptide (TPR) repeat protein